MKRFEKHLQKFEHTYGMLLKVIGAFVALFTLTIIYKQIEVSSGQTEAVWFANRPFLTILKIDESSQVVEYTGDSLYLLGRLRPASDFSLVKFIIKNAGRSPAELDSAFYQIVTGDTVRVDSAGYEYIQIAPDEMKMITMEIPLARYYVNHILIRLKYNWSEPNSDDDPLVLRDNFEAVVKDKKWQFENISRERIYELMESRNIVLN